MNFRYFKNQYSALCKENALFEVSTEKIIKFTSYVKASRYFIEITYRKNMPTLPVSNSSGSLTIHKPNNSQKALKKVPHHANSKSITNNSEETIVFATSSLEEWKKWVQNLTLYIIQ